MKLAIQINASPHQHQASDSAYHFIKAAIRKGHQVLRVFFYHDGVLNALPDSAPPTDERNLVQRWSELARTHQLDLVVCVSAAQRRGVFRAESSNAGPAEQAKLADGFRIAGLGLMMEAVLDADRLVVFGA